MANPARRSTMGPMNFLDDSRLSMSMSGKDRSSIGAPLRNIKVAPPTTGKKESSHMSRLSIAGGGAGDIGRGSLFGRLTSAGGRVGEKTDPRAITSKAFQNEAIGNIVEFCQATNFRNGPISTKILSNPTGKDFANVMLHLCQQLDPTFSLAGKVEDDVTTLLKALRYPFVPSKTALTAVGSPATYPTVLASMDWIVDLLTYDATARMKDEEDIENALAAGPLMGASQQQPTSSTEVAFFFTYVSEAYEAFLTGDDAKVAELDDALEKAFSVRYEDTEREIEDLRRTNEGLKSELAATRSIQSSLPQLRANVAELEASNDRLLKTEQDLLAARESLSAKLEKETKLAAERERELERHQLALSDVEKRLGSQELSSADVERMAQRKQQLREQYFTLRDNASTLERQMDTERAGLKQAISALQHTISEYTTSATKLQLLPMGAKYSFGVDFSLRLNDSYLESVGCSNDTTFGGADLSISMSSHTGEFNVATNGAASAATTTALLGADLKTTIKPQLRELRAKMQKQAGEHGKTLLDLAEALTQFAEAREEATKKVEGLTRKLKSTEDQVNALRGDVDSTLANAESETGQLATIVTQTRAELAAAHASVRELNPEVLHGLKLAIDSQIKTMDAVRKRLSDRIAASLLQVTSHKELVTSKLSGLKSRFHAYKNDYVAKPPPSMPSVPIMNAVTSAGIAVNAATSKYAMPSSYFAHDPRISAAVPTPSKSFAMPVIPASLSRASIDALPASALKSAPGSAMSTMSTPGGTYMPGSAYGGAKVSNVYDETVSARKAYVPSVQQRLAFEHSGF